MKKIYLFIIGIFTLASFTAQAQDDCPTATGMIGIPIKLNGNCFITVQHAIPNSTVFVYNANTLVAQGIANNAGTVTVSYPCVDNPIISLASVQFSPVFKQCQRFIIAQLIVLPIKLTSFTGTLNAAKTVTLKWDVEWELNNDKYEIERSTDGTNFTKIGTLNSMGDQTTKQSYHFQDATFTASTAAFYRLKQTDLDGKFSYSKVVYINDKASAASEYNLFPNPLSNSNSSFQIKGISANEVNTKNIRITDMSGRNIAYKIVGANAIEMAPTTPSGIYLIRVKDKTLKLVKN